jgi:hypothetical protein
MMRAPLKPYEMIAHIIVPLCFALYLTFFPLTYDFIFPDSESYLYYSELRASVYPLFLSAIRVFSDQLISVTYVQIWLFALSVSCLSLAILRISGSHGFTLFITIPLCLNPYSLYSHSRVLPDSLVISLSLLMLTCLIHNLFKARIRGLLGFGFFIGLVISTVSTGWAYILLIFFAAPLIAQQNSCSRTKAFMLPLIGALMIIFFESTLFANLHPETKTSLLPTQLFAKVSLMDTRQSSPYAVNDPRTDIWNMIEHNLAPVRSIIWQAPDFATRTDFLTRYEKFLSVSFADMQIKSASYILKKTNDDIRMDIAIARIIQDPMAFLSIVFDHYRSLWTINAHDHPNDVNHVNMYRAQNSPYPLMNTQGEIQKPNTLAPIQQPVFYGFWLLSFLTLIFGFWALISRYPFSNFFATSFICALLVHSQTIWMAFSNVGISDMMLPLSPILIVGSLSLILGFYCAFISPIRTDH